MLKILAKRGNYLIKIEEKIKINKIIILKLKKL